MTRQDYQSDPGARWDLWEDGVTTKDAENTKDQTSGHSVAVEVMITDRELQFAGSPERERWFPTRSLKPGI